jgi:hypothetical protein
VTQCPDAIYERNCFRIARAVPEVIFFRHSYDGFNDIWEATTAAAALFHGMVNLGRDNQLPRISIEKFNDRILDLFLRDNVAMAN